MYRALGVKHRAGNVHRVSSTVHSYQGGTGARNLVGCIGCEAPCMYSALGVKHRALVAKGYRYTQSVYAALGVEHRAGTVHRVSSTVHLYREVPVRATRAQCRGNATSDSASLGTSVL